MFKVTVSDLPMSGDIHDNGSIVETIYTERLDLVIHPGGIDCLTLPPMPGQRSLRTIPIASGDTLRTVRISEVDHNEAGERRLLAALRNPADAMRELDAELADAMRE